MVGWVGGWGWLVLVVGGWTCGVWGCGQPVLRVKLDQSYLAAIKIFCSWSRSTVIVNIVLGAPSKKLKDSSDWRFNMLRYKLVHFLEERSEENGERMNCFKASDSCHASPFLQMHPMTMHPSRQGRSSADNFDK